MEILNNLLQTKLIIHKETRKYLLFRLIIPLVSIPSTQLHSRLILTRIICIYFTGAAHDSDSRPDPHPADADCQLSIDRDQCAGFHCAMALWPQPGCADLHFRGHPGPVSAWTAPG